MRGKLVLMVSVKNTKHYYYLPVLLLPEPVSVPCEEELGYLPNQDDHGGHKGQVQADPEGLEREKKLFFAGKLCEKHKWAWGWPSGGGEQQKKALNVFVRY